MNRRSMRFRRAHWIALAVAMGVPALLLCQSAAFEVEFVANPDAVQTWRQRLNVPAAAVRESVQDGHARVLVGPFEYTADARIVGDYLRGISSTSPTIRSGELNGSYQDPLDFLPSLLGVTDQRSSMFSTKNLSGTASYEAIEALDKPESQEAFRQALQAAEANCAEADPLLGYAKLNLGIAALLDGDFGEARRHLEPVATNQVACTPNHRIMAMWRLAWMKHQEKDLASAYRLYLETLRYADDNSKTRARMIKELTGLIMEMAKDEGKGSLKEVRAFVDQKRSTVSPVYSDDLATINLMYAETYYYQGDLEHFLEVVDQYISGFPQQAAKQRAMLTIFKGLAQDKQGDSRAALDSLRQVLDLDLPQGPHFQAIPDLKAHAQEWIDEIVRKQASGGAGGSPE